MATVKKTAKKTTRKKTTSRKATPKNDTAKPKPRTGGRKNKGYVVLQKYDLVVHEHRRLGIPTAETQKVCGISKNTVTAARKRVDAALDGDPMIAQWRDLMATLLPEAVAAVQRGMKKNNSSIVNGFLKGLGVYVEKSIVDPGSPFEGMSNDDLDAEVVEVVTRSRKRRVSQSKSD